MVTLDQNEGWAKETSELLKEFFRIMDRIESNDDGTRYFRPTYISSCRVLDSHRLGQILGDLRERVGLSRNPPEIPPPEYIDDYEDEVG